MDIRECINYLLTTAQHQVFQLLSSKLAPYGITPGQYGVLNCLWRKEAVNPKEMAQILGLETSTISGVLDRMQKKGLIDRVVDPNDRRCVQVVITPMGAALEEPVLQIIQELNEEVLRDFSREEATTLTRCLKQIAEKI
ncbi:MAG: MarR family transcriptional regulator [Clostridiales bacterium]|jgi:DNA-binding MarR family transcriptional regulator|uniref:MarR family transcriptional regulator n=1 Tax=Intestinimonas massiliensis (ex Afouda et al. 2020) TaxID=1673721 RepID=A0AAW5JTD8_9FIRM|nr:MarR family transcriptional regulator [Intestinimonas massiliensis (ex Afouda et al. 2020)]MBS6281740.1 MarR family transcriptional regulator [Oscillospiraceae bacterium]MDU1324997.1 MarR family transcriptional regulator [Clostridiales bacterium]CUP65200.1 transcriptional regulator [Flavonifractor plautii]SCI70957.1 Multiple antibiotic resistance protein marR [uncultured Flavonifractor sp.]MCQ4771179.1 MarR family transcriptional regulator [Intestinimonas massiliensis (ex Afouda et al. 2020